MCDGWACRAERAIERAIDLLDKVPPQYRTTEVIYAEVTLREFDRRPTHRDGKVSDVSS